MFPGLTPADDWPQWMGRNRDGVWHEDGIVERFPEGGLKVLWRQPVGLGYAGPAVVAGKVFVTDYQRTAGEVTNSPGGKTKLEGRERILCLNAATGEMLWKHEYDCPYELLIHPARARLRPSRTGMSTCSVPKVG